MRDQNAEDNKILCVPLTDPNWSHIERLDDLPMTLRDEISHFFSIYKTPEWKVVKVDGWYPREEALESIERARKRWQEAQEGAEGSPAAGRHSHGGGVRTTTDRLVGRGLAVRERGLEALLGLGAQRALQDVAAVLLDLGEHLVGGAAADEHDQRRAAPGSSFCAAAPS